MHFWAFSSKYDIIKKRNTLLTAQGNTMFPQRKYTRAKQSSLIVRAQALSERQCGVSQKVVAAKYGISVKTLRRWEQQERQLGPGPGQVVDMKGCNI